MQFLTALVSHRRVGGKGERHHPMLLSPPRITNPSGYSPNVRERKDPLLWTGSSGIRAGPSPQGYGPATVSVVARRREAARAETPG